MPDIFGYIRERVKVYMLMTIHVSRRFAITKNRDHVDTIIMVLKNAQLLGRNGECHKSVA